MKKTIVYILSSPHSGSTLLDLILSSSPSASSLGEFSYVFYKLKGKNPVCKKCKYWSKFAKKFKRYKKSNRYHNAAFDIFKTPILLDSSKRMKWIDTKTRSKDINIKIIKLTRYGLATLLKKKRKQGRINERHVNCWVEGNRRMDNYISKFDDTQKMSVRYEDLCLDPPVVVKKCCDFMGIEYNSDMLDFWQTKHHIIKGNSKPINLIRLYHKTMRLEDMHEDFIDFFERTGFNLKLDVRYTEKFSPQEVELFNNLAGEFCGRYGY